MSPPFFFAAAVAALSPFSSKKKNSSNRDINDVTTTNNSFFVGVVTGVGLTWLISSQIQRRRIRERIRLGVLRLFEDSPPQSGEESGVKKEGEENPLYLATPTKILDLAGKSIGDSGSILRSVVSPNNAATSTLVVSVLTLPPGSQLSARVASGVECYYILQGTGIITKQDCEEMSISKDEVVLVDPWRLRSFTNNGWEELVILRATDGGLGCVREGYDAVETESTSTSERLTTFLGSVSEVGNYFKSKRNQGSADTA